MPKLGRVSPIVLTMVALCGCRERKPTVEQPDEIVVAEVEAVDARAICESGCERLAQCVPSLTAEANGRAADVAERLVGECSDACIAFSTVTTQTPGATLRLELAQQSARALRDCLPLDSCNAFWGCVSIEEARPWLAAVAPVGERSCENLCSQASACAIAKVCDDEAGKAANGPTACLADDARRSELEEGCLLQCAATPDESQARRELVGCLDHVSCGGMLTCLDTWAQTAYEPGETPIPGISPSCDSFCTRAIDCGAQAEGIDLSPDELSRLREAMTSTWIECAVQCEKDLERGAKPETFDKCTASEDCNAFVTCSEGA